MMRPACGLQKQFWSEQAATMLYWPMTSRPPNSETTDQSASLRTQLRPNHTASTTVVPAMAVRSPSYHVPNRFARAQPAAPTLRGGGLTSVSLYSLAIHQPPVKRMCRLYRLPINDQVRLMAR